MGIFSRKKQEREPGKSEDEDADSGKREEKKKAVDISEKVDEGYLHVRVIVEMAGAPKDHLEQVIDALSKRIKADFEVVDFFVEDLEEKGKLFHTFMEIELLFRNTDELIGFCFDYMPSNVEVLAPAKFVLDSARFSNLVNDLLGKLHHMDDVLKEIQADNRLLRMNSTTLFKNMVLVALAPGEKDLEKLIKLTGFKKESLEPLLAKMVEEKLISKDDAVYSLVKR
ncbi:hypothetical protein JW968_06090 [Candidatus Woesearchaeota archaeon]|nr:hypothetical protein [Candidatus Woesearchaeota archaeon]